MECFKRHSLPLKYGIVGSILTEIHLFFLSVSLLPFLFYSKSVIILYSTFDNDSVVVDVFALILGTKSSPLRKIIIALVVVLVR